MSVQEYLWLADHHYVMNKYQQEEGFVSMDERQSIREMHAQKKRKV